MREMSTIYLLIKRYVDVKIEVYGHKAKELCLSVQAGQLY